MAKVQVNFRASDHDVGTLAATAERQGCSKSEVLRKGIAITDLQSLKAERSKMQSRLAEIEVARTKLGETDSEVEKCQAALQRFANSVSEKIDIWTGGGCVGHRPEPAFDAHAKLEEKLHRALFARENAKTAHDTLDVRDADARRELSAIGWRLREAVAHQLCFEISEQGEAILALRAQLADLEASQLGGHDFARALDDEVYERTGKRAPAFHFWSDLQGLPRDPFSRGPAEPAQVRSWRDRFGVSFLVKQRPQRPRKPPPPQPVRPIRKMSDMVLSDLQVIAYYKRPDGAYEKVPMFRLDYDEALEREPHVWSLTPPPAGAEVIDKTPKEFLGIGE